MGIKGNENYYQMMPEAGGAAQYPPEAGAGRHSASMQLQAARAVGKLAALIREAPVTAHPQKLHNLLQMAPEARLDYFIRKIADFEVVWALVDAQGQLARGLDRSSVPFWPEAAFAILCACGPWQGFSAQPMAVTEFLARCPGLQVEVFPVPDQPGLRPEMAELVQQIREELEQYE
jgi:hypothetical protein